MILYHGTTDTVLNDIIKNGFKSESWFAKYDFHAYRLAVRRSKQRGGKPVVLKVKVDESNVKRVVGRDLPTYILNIENVKPLEIMQMVSEKVV